MSALPTLPTLERYAGACARVFLHDDRKRIVSRASSCVGSVGSVGMLDFYTESSGLKRGQ